MVRQLQPVMWLISLVLLQVLRGARVPDIRELRNLVERFVVLVSDEEIVPCHLPEWIMGLAKQPAAVASRGFALPAEGLSLEALEHDLIRQALERTRHNKAQAAKLLGLTYDALRYQVKKFAMD